MKKFITAIMAILYIGISSGIVVNMHYCMNKLASVSVQYQHNDTCGKCGMKAKDGCCKDELKIVKLSGDHKYTGQAELIFAVKGMPVNTDAFMPRQITLASTYLTNLRAKGPPLLSSPDIYLKNRVFRV